MVIDTSAVIALLLSEEEANAIAQSIASASVCRMSAATYLETSIVIEARFGPEGGDKLEMLLENARIVIESVTHEQADVARIAYRIYGKGRHPAGLNFGDCFAYALAVFHDEPLLFKGNDFAQTDVTTAMMS